MELSVELHRLEMLHGGSDRLLGTQRLLEVLSQMG
jgi:hypothetical protein